MVTGVGMGHRSSCWRGYDHCLLRACLRATATQTFTVTKAPLTIIAPPVLTQVSAPPVILTNPAKPPALTDTVLLSGTTVGANNTDPVTFTLRVTPNSGLPAYTVTNITNPVANGDGYYSTSYQLSTDELTAAGTYVWTASYPDANSSQIITAVQTGPAVKTANVYATLDGTPITQYWDYPTSRVNIVALLDQVNLNQPIGYFGTNPNAPPVVYAGAQWHGPTYSTSAPTSTPVVGVSPIPGSISKVTISVLVRKIMPHKVTHTVERHGKLVTISTIVKQVVWTTVDRSIRAWNPQG